MIDIYWGHVHVGSTRHVSTGLVHNLVFYINCSNIDSMYAFRNYALFLSVIIQICSNETTRDSL